MAEMEKSEVLWLRYEQQVMVQGNTFEKIKHSLNLVYEEHLVKITFIIEKLFAFYQFSYKGHTRESFSQWC